MNNDSTALALGQQPTINTSGIDTHALIEEWNSSKYYVDSYTRDFIQLDNLVDGIPIKHQPGETYVGDTTLGGMVRQIPRDSLQQLPVFSAIVNGSKNSVKALLCTYMLKKTAFNEDTFGKGLLSTLIIGAEQALTHGYAPFMVATGQIYNDFGTTMRLLHFSDTAPEPGISDANESGYHYVVANLTPSRVRRILRAARKNPNTSWSIPGLEQVLATAPRAKEYSIYESSVKRNAAGEAAGPAYQFVTRYETGPDATIITFCPQVSETPLRVLDNNSKWGYPRVMYLVIDPAALTPFGVSRVRLASPNQNLMNIYYGHIAAMLLLNSKPPILKRGRFIKPIQLKQGAVWETLDQNASADLKTIDNGALQSFPQMQQQFALQIQNVMGKTTSMAGGAANTLGFGKTGPGVKQAAQVQDASVNQITKILENFLRQYALVALDTMISEKAAEQGGDEKIIVDDETKNQLNALQPGLVGDDNKVTINWEDFYFGEIDQNDPTGMTRTGGIEEWSVEVSVSISKDQLDDEKRGDLQDMLVVLAQNAQELGPSAVQKVEEITNMLMADKAPLLKPLPVGPTAPPAMPQGQPQMPPQGQPAMPPVSQ